MKKYLFSIFLLLYAFSFHNSSGAQDKKCGGANRGYELDSVTGAVTFERDCVEIVGTAFSNAQQSVTSIDLSNTSVTTIDNEAFSGCTSLSSIQFPNSLSQIGLKAFFNCKSLVSVNLSNASLTSIGIGAFQDCSKLTSIDLSNQQCGVGSNAFLGIGYYSDATITVTRGSYAHEELGDRGIRSDTGDPINGQKGTSSTTLIVNDSPTPTPTPTARPTSAPGTPTPTSDPLIPTFLPTSTPMPESNGNYGETIPVVPLPEDEFGSYDVDPVTGEKTYLIFNTYSICMDFLSNEELCSSSERCYFK